MQERWVDEVSTDSFAEEVMPRAVRIAAPISACIPPILTFMPIEPGEVSRVTGRSVPWKRALCHSLAASKFGLMCAGRASGLDLNADLSGRGRANTWKPTIGTIDQQAGVNPTLPSRGSGRDA